MGEQCHHVGLWYGAAVCLFVLASAATWFACHAYPTYHYEYAFTESGAPLRVSRAEANAHRRDVLASINQKIAQEEREYGISSPDLLLASKSFEQRIQHSQREQRKAIVMLVAGVAATVLSLSGAIASARTALLTRRSLKQRGPKSV